MGNGPALPSDCTLPTKLGRWKLDRAAPKNGHIWYGPNKKCSLGVYGFCGDIVVKVHDERVGGFSRSKRLFEITPHTREEYYHPKAGATETPAVIKAIERAGQWMAKHPGGWEHPAVEPSAFTPPPGFVLEGYWLESREHIVCYRQENFEGPTRMSAHDDEFEATLSTCEYLYVEVWRGSGNATVSLAPWVRAHESHKHEVVEVPDGCGVEVAVESARDWVEKNRTPDHGLNPQFASRP